MKSIALGRGLDALLGEVSEAYNNEASPQNQILEISLKDIKPNPFQPRKDFNNEALLELSESIKNDGLLQPIVLSEDIDGYVIVAGERRYRASKLAKLKTIKAIIINSDEEKMRQFALIENIQRENLNSIELAIAYNELIKIHNLTHEDLSCKINKSRTHITNTIRLLQLSQKTQKALIDRKITTGHAKILVGLDETKQELLVNSIVGQKLSVREIESMAKSLKENISKTVKNIELEELNFSVLEDKLKKITNDFKCLNNKLIIKFKNQEDIENFLSYF